MATMIQRPTTWTDTAPVQVVAEREMTATPQEVWDVLCDHAGWTGWFPRLQASRATGGEGLGSTRTVRVANADVHEEFTVWDEPRAWGFAVVEAAGALRFAAETLNERVDIDELDGGRVRVTYRMGFQPRRGRGVLMKAAAVGLGKNLEAALVGLEGAVAARR